MSGELRYAAEWLADVRAEWGKTWSVWVPALWLLAGVLISLVTSTALANDFVHGISVGELPRTARMPVVDAFGPSVSFAQVAVAGFAIHLVTPEYASGSVASTLIAQPRRWVVVTAKGFVAGVIGFALGALTGPIAGWADSWVLGSAQGEPLSFGVAGLGMGIVFASAAAIGIALSFVLRSAVGALSAGFVLLVVTLAAPTSLGRWLPGQAGVAVVQDLAAGQFPWEGLTVLAVWMLVLGVASCWLVAHRDA
jgi:ABC-2 type transport system permease protein